MAPARAPSHLIHVIFVTTTILSFFSRQINAQTTYVESATNAISCPAGSEPLESEQECRDAVTVLGGTYYSGNDDGYAFQVGCFYDIDNTEYFWEAVGGGGLTNYKLVCKVVPVTTNSGGDPHFIGFSDKTITYQGECTLILLQSPCATASGDDVTVHVRTTRKLDFSYISGVAMKIGDDVIEATPRGELIFNKEVLKEDGTVTMSGLPFVMTKETKGTKQNIVSYSFDLGNGRVIDIQANKKRGMMFVRTKGAFPNETKGMLGSPGSTDMFTRDGRNLATVDINTYGESWQVKDTDEQLFQEALGPQYPQKCLYEDAPGATAQLRGRRKLLLKKVVTVEEATAACMDVKGSKRDLCIQDTIAMGDLEIKDDPFYTNE